MFLVGFMGSGKTTVGRLLAGFMDYGFIDLDDRIEARAGRTIPELFDRYGEDDFRRRETSALEVMLDEEQVVVATGGGLMTSASNRALLSRAGRTVWLNPSFETISRRVSADRQARPLFVDAAQAAALFGRRLADYGAADERVDVTDGEEPGVTARRVAEIFRSCAT